MTASVPTQRHRAAGPVFPVWSRRALHAFFGIPLFLKVLIANCGVVLLGVVVGTWFTLTFVEQPGGHVQWLAVAVMLIAGSAASLLINAGVLALALQPLHALERTVERVARGDLGARSHTVLFADPDVGRLGDTLNDMLDVLQAHRGQLQMLSEQVLTAQEGERKRIARELHDETAQSLTTLLIRLKILEGVKNSAELRNQIADLRALTLETLEAVRTLAIELRPSMLDDLGLAAALEAYTDTYASRMEVQLTFQVHGFESPERLPAEIELVLYRVVQEALTNAAKHARARTVSVILHRDASAVAASISDDGDGFDVAAVMGSRERGLGLFGMKERLALVQGQLTIESTPGTGTHVEARAPLTAPLLRSAA